MASSRTSNADIVHEVLNQAEGTLWETKRVSGKMVGKALETICAFSNGEGGLLVLGVEDSEKAQGEGRLFGLSENREALAELKRKIGSHFVPSIEAPTFRLLPIRNRNGQSDDIALVKITPGGKVHSIVDDGTWLRVENTNRQMTAAEITALSYKRGVVSAETELIDIDVSLIDTDSFKTYCEQRGLRRGTLEQRLETIGLARRDRGKLKPTKAAVLLFAQSPSDLLALSGGRSGVRVFHYAGTTIDTSEHPNLRKPPKNISAPIYELIEAAEKYILDEIAHGFEMVGGFAAKHAYPKRVVKEAITNAILHRDYRHPRDVNVRILDDRIEIESPGEFPANITPSTIETAGSIPRNPSIVNHLREFPAPPNVDAGEGVPMMFGEMKEKGLYPPRYAVGKDAAVPTVTVTLLNEQRPAVWEQVSAYIDKHGSIANRELRKIASLETLRATRMFKGWVDKGLLVMRGSGKKDARYSKPNLRSPELFSLFGDVKGDDLESLAPVIDTEPAAEKRLANVPRKGLNQSPPRKEKSSPKKRKRS